MHIQKKGLYVMKTKDVVLNEIIKELNWKERLVVKIFRKTFSKSCNITRIDVINKLMQF